MNKFSKLIIVKYLTLWIFSDPLKFVQCGADYIMYVNLIL